MEELNDNIINKINTKGRTDSQYNMEKLLEFNFNNTIQLDLVKTLVQLLFVTIYDSFDNMLNNDYIQITTHKLYPLWKYLKISIVVKKSWYITNKTNLINNKEDYRKVDTNIDIKFRKEYRLMYIINNFKKGIKNPNFKDVYKDNQQYVIIFMLSYLYGILIDNNKLKSMMKVNLNQNIFDDFDENIFVNDKLDNPDDDDWSTGGARDPFYMKYLKYKLKYLSLKKQISFH